MTEISGELFESLAQKFESLDLSEQEAQVVDAILQRAAAIDTDEDVSGFWFQTASQTFRPQPYRFQSPFAQRLSLSAGFNFGIAHTQTETETIQL